MEPETGEQKTEDVGPRKEENLPPKVSEAVDEKPKGIDLGEDPNKDVVELGDRILVLGGKHDRLRGRVYYRDGEMIRILPDGVSNSLQDIPLVDEEPDPELKIQEIVILRKRPRDVDAFVELFDLRVDMRVDTFTAKGEEGPKFTISKVSPEEDSVLFLDENNEQYPTAGPLELNGVGIPLDEPFAVLRTYMPEEVAKAVAPTEVSNETQLAPGTEPDEEEEIFEFLEDEVELPVREEEPIVPSSKRTYDDLDQKKDAIRDFKQQLSDAAQKNPRRIREIRILVETYLQMRNSLASYNQVGDYVGLKETSYETLSELLRSTKFPLARPVVNSARVFQFDHSPEHYDAIAKAGTGPETDAGTVDQTTSSDPAVEIRYLSDTVKESDAYIENQFKQSASTGTLDPVAIGMMKNTLPQWYVGWNTFYERFMSQLPTIGTITDVVKHDFDVFRGEEPVADVKDSELTGLPHLSGADNTQIINADVLGKVAVSRLRALGPHYQRYGEKHVLGISESADSLHILMYILFPLIFLRELGATRSGNLVMDVAHSMYPLKTTKEMLDLAGPITDVPKANMIIKIDPERSTLGNIAIGEWLKGQPIYGRGMGDIIPFLVSLGIYDKELTEDQLATIHEKTDQYRAALKKFLNEEREKATEALANQNVQTDTVLPREDAAALIEKISGEVLLNDALLKFLQRHPYYKESDLARFSALYKEYQDLLLAVLGDVPEFLVRERNRQVKDNILAALRDGLALKKKNEMSSEAPKQNPCAHVESLQKIRKTRDDMDRMRLLALFLRTFRGEKKDHWIWCIVCKEHLLCEHEFLQIQEFLRPKEKDVLHKEILLNFSDGVFMGKYSCRTCGEGIADLEYDTNLEFDDEGKPMMGRTVLVDEDAAKLEEIEKILEAPAKKDDVVDFGTEDKNLIYKTIREIADLVGIFPDPEGYGKMVERTYAEIRKLPDRARYGAMVQTQEKARAAARAAGKSVPTEKILDYDIYTHRYMVGAAAATLLINIQTRIPDYIRRYTLEGCSNPEFTGFPMDKLEKRAGIDYLACAISSITRQEPPWNMTGLQSIRADETRQQEISRYLTKIVSDMSQKTEIQQEIATKKQYLLETFGVEAAEGRPRDIVPDGFVPVQVVLPKAKEAYEPILAEAAKSDTKAYAWMKQAHVLARQNGIFIPGSPLVETTCCYTPVITPGKFWADSGLPAFEAEKVTRGTVGTRLFVKMKPRPIEPLFTKVQESDLYRPFTTYCFRGPRTGYPHEPGYNWTCPYCSYKYAEDPRLPGPTIQAGKDHKKAEKEFEEERARRNTADQQAVETALGRKVTRKDFDELLDAVYSRSKVVMPKAAGKPLMNIALLQSLLQLKPQPFDTFNEIITETIVRLQELAEKQATKREYADAYGLLSDKVTELQNKLARRMNEEAYTKFMALFDLGPLQLGEHLRANYLVVFNRILNNVSLDLLKKVQPSYNLAYGAIMDIQSFMDVHYSVLQRNVTRLNATPFGRAKMADLVEKLKAVIPVLTRSLRVNVVPGGSIGLPYIMKALVLGIFESFINPNSIPAKFEASVGGNEDMFSSSMTTILSVFSQMIEKASTEGLNYTDEQIRDMMAKRDELEKAKIIRDLDQMSAERKRVEMINKKLGLGPKWSIGGTDVVRLYNPEQYERERQEMEAAGIVRFPGLEGADLPQQDLYALEGEAVTNDVNDKFADENE